MDLEFWFDFSCPYAYLASREIEAVCARTGATLHLKPMLLGGVFRDTGAGEGPMATLTPHRALHNVRDMHRWADLRGAPLRIPSGHPQRTVLALRTFLGLPVPRWPAAMHALYAAYFEHARDVADPAVILDALTAAGIPEDEQRAALNGAATEERKAELRRRTDEAVALGIFGAPAMVLRRPDGPLLVWGQDRLHWIEAMLAGWVPDRGPPAPRLPAVAERPATGRVDSLDFWFDYSSPFAYLGATQIARVAREAGAAVRWRPMLLGALFRDVGTADIPLFTLPAAKRAYVGRELALWSRWWGVDFRFTSRFPIRSITALRLTLLAGDQREPLIARIFRAAWVDDLDVTDPAVLRGLCVDSGVDPALVDRTAEPAVKQELIDETRAAAEAGVFGAPTVVVPSPGGPLLFWGQDRMDLIAAAIRGWRPSAEPAE